MGVAGSGETRDGTVSIAEGGFEYVWPPFERVYWIPFALLGVNKRRVYMHSGFDKNGGGDTPEGSNAGREDERVRSTCGVREREIVELIGYRAGT